MSQGGREGERCGSSATPRSRATRRSSESGPSGRCETLASAAGLAHRALGRGTRLRVFGICRRGARHRSLWTGLRGAGHRRHRGGHRPRGQLPRTQPQTWFLAPGVPRRAGVRCPFLFDRRLRARPFRRHPAAGQFRNPAGRDHELRLEDAPQLLLEPLDQPCDPLSRRCLRVGLHVRNSPRAMDSLSRRVLDRLASEAHGGGGPGAGAGAHPDACRRHPGRSRLVCRGASADGYPDLPARHLSAELLELQRRPREPGPPTGPAHRRSDGRDDQRRPALSGKARRCARDVRADRRPRLLARPGFRPVSRWRLDSHESRLPRDAAIRATAIPATCAAPQPRHLRADISGPTTAAGRDQRRLPDREPVRAGDRAARGCLRNFPHARAFATGPDILGRLLPARSLA